MQEPSIDTPPLTVLMRRPSARMDQGELSFLERRPVDFALAERQHAAYRQAAIAAGARVIEAPADDRFPDSVFIEDVVLAFPEAFVLCRPGALSRAEEPDLIVPHLPADRPVLRLEAPATLDGGDVLRIGREVFVGVSQRSNAAAAEALQRLLEPYGYRVTPVTVTGALHLKTAVTAPADHVLLANPAWVDLASFGNRPTISVDPAEPFAANGLRIGDRLFLPAAHPRTAARLGEAGLTVTPLDVSEFAKLEAGLTCMSVVIAG